MKKLLGKFYLWIHGWDVDVSPEIQNLKKAVYIAAPHTSNWDLPMALAGYWALGIKLKFFIKDDYTKKWYGDFFKRLGAIGVDRGNIKNNLVQYAVDLFSRTKELVLMVPAEGTRKRAEKWKKGFFYISQGADVPVVLAYLDYAKKKAGAEKIVYTKDRPFEEVMQEIQDFYKDITGKHPEQYNKQIY